MAACLDHPISLKKILLLVAVIACQDVILRKQLFFSFIIAHLGSNVPRLTENHNLHLKGPTTLFSIISFTFLPVLFLFVPSLFACPYLHSLSTTLPIRNNPSFIFLETYSSLLLYSSVSLFISHLYNYFFFNSYKQSLWFEIPDHRKEPTSLVSSIFTMQLHHPKTTRRQLDDLLLAAAAEEARIPSVVIINTTSNSITAPHRIVHQLAVKRTLPCFICTALVNIPFIFQDAAKHQQITATATTIRIHFLDAINQYPGNRSR